jgi:hypothetical protein
MGSCMGNSPAPLLLTLRGGEQGGEEDIAEPPKKNGFLDASGAATALTAFGTFYSSSLEYFPILTKSVTVSSFCAFTYIM